MRGIHAGLRFKLREVSQEAIGYMADLEDRLLVVERENADLLRENGELRLRLEQRG